MYAIHLRSRQISHYGEDSCGLYATLLASRSWGSLVEITDILKSLSDDGGGGARLGLYVRIASFLREESLDDFI